jgi:hypothetical protein
MSGGDCCESEGIEFVNEAEIEPSLRCRVCQRPSSYQYGVCVCVECKGPLCFDCVTLIDESETPCCGAAAKWKKCFLQEKIGTIQVRCKKEHCGWSGDWRKACLHDCNSRKFPAPVPRTQESEIDEILMADVKYTVVSEHSESCARCSNQVRDLLQTLCCERYICDDCCRGISCLFGCRPGDNFAVRYAPLKITVECHGCRQLVTRGHKDYLFRKHLREACPVECPYLCSALIFRSEILEHTKVCGSRVYDCSAADVGCPFRSTRARMAVHLQACTFQRDAPLLRRIKALEMTNKVLVNLVKSMRESTSCE